MNTEPEKEWSGKTDGTPWMQRALVRACRMMPTWMPHVPLTLVSLGYVFVNGKSSRDIFNYYRKHQRYNLLHSLWATYYNHFLFGTIILDRFMFFAGKKYKIDIEGYDIFAELNARSEGFVIFSSHTGNFEMAGFSLNSTNKEIHTLVYGGETETVMRNRKKVLDRNNIKMIKTSADMSHLLEINNTLATGNIVSLPTDRIFGSAKSVTVNFMNGEVQLPAGPFSVAAQRQAPAIGVFVNKTGLKSYKVRVARIDSRIDGTLKRREQIKAMAQVYADELAKTVREFPNQWFNYYDYWHDRDKKNQKETQASVSYMPQ